MSLVKAVPQAGHEVDLVLDSLQGLLDEVLVVAGVAALSKPAFQWDADHALIADAPLTDGTSCPEQACAPAAHAQRQDRQQDGGEAQLGLHQQQDIACTPTAVSSAACVSIAGTAGDVEVASGCPGAATSTVPLQAQAPQATLQDAQRDSIRMQVVGITPTPAEHAESAATLHSHDLHLSPHPRQATAELAESAPPLTCQTSTAPDDGASTSGTLSDDGKEPAAVKEGGLVNTAEPSRSAAAMSHPVVASRSPDAVAASNAKEPSVCSTGLSVSDSMVFAASTTVQAMTLVAVHPLAAKDPTAGVAAVEPPAATLLLAVTAAAVPAADGSYASIEAADCTPTDYTTPTAGSTSKIDTTLTANNTPTAAVLPAEAAPPAADPPRETSPCPLDRQAAYEKPATVQTAGGWVPSAAVSPVIYRGQGPQTAGASVTALAAAAVAAVDAANKAAAHANAAAAAATAAAAAATAANAALAVASAAAVHVSEGSPSPTACTYQWRLVNVQPCSAGPAQPAASASSPATAAAAALADVATAATTAASATAAVAAATCQATTAGINAGSSSEAAETAESRSAAADGTLGSDGQHAQQGAVCGTTEQSNDVAMHGNGNSADHTQVSLSESRPAACSTEDSSQSDTAPQQHCLPTRSSIAVALMSSLYSQSSGSMHEHEHEHDASLVDTLEHTGTAAGHNGTAKHGPHRLLQAQQQHREEPEQSGPTEEPSTLEEAWKQLPGRYSLESPLASVVGASLPPCPSDPGISRHASPGRCKSAKSVTEGGMSFKRQGSSGVQRYAKQGSKSLKALSFSADTRPAEEPTLLRPSLLSGMASLFNKSKPEAAKLAVRVLQARGLSYGAGYAVRDSTVPFVAAFCEGNRQLAAATNVGESPSWEAFFLFNVLRPKFAILRIKVLASGGCCSHRVIGEVELPVRAVMEDPHMFQEPEWYPVTWHGHDRGEIQLLVYVQHAVARRPLQVFCGTWNVGNAKPSTNLSSWLRGVEQGEHDIVAIGVQECSYKHKDPKEDITWQGPQHTSRHLSDSDTCSPRARNMNRSNSMPDDPSKPVYHASPLSKEPTGHTSLFDFSRGSSLNMEENDQEAPSRQPSSNCQAGARAGSATGYRRSGTGGEVGSPRKLAVATSMAPLRASPSFAALTDDMGTPRTPHGGEPAFGHELRSKSISHGHRESFKDVWEQLMKQELGSGYWLLKSSHMGQIRLLLFVRNDLLPAVSAVHRGSQPTGIGGVYTNKGGVAVSLKVWDTELCFINSHLAAHQGKCSHRASDYSNIIKGIRLDQWRMDLTTAYHHVFWMGDLNYRLDYGRQAVTMDESPDPVDFRELERTIESGAHGQLLEFDQLAKEVKAHRAFTGFHEGEITFAPTFKVHRRAGMLYTQQRSPAWCDRVLWKSALPHKQTTALDYFAAEGVASSDHKPVGAKLLVPTVWFGSAEGPDGQAAPDVILEILWCSARQLPTLRSAGDDTHHHTGHLPSPKVLFLGPCLKEAAATHTEHSTCDPKWRGPFRMQLRPAQVADLLHYRLLVRVVDRKNTRRSQLKLQQKDITLARGVLPLAEAALQLAKDSMAAVRFQVPLHYNGLPAGTLEGQMHFVRANAQPSMDANSLQSRMRRTSMQIAQGLGLMKNAPARQVTQPMRIEEGRDSQEGGPGMGAGIDAQQSHAMQFSDRP